MDASVLALDEFDPPARLIDRLKQIPGCTWDENSPIYHSSYDTWHVTGTRFAPTYITCHPATPAQAAVVPHSSPVTSPPLSNAASPLSLPRPSPGRTGALSETHSNGGNLFSSHSESCSECSAASTPPLANANSHEAPPLTEEPVVARVSFHVLREERAFQLAKNLVSSCDPRGEHIAKPVDLIRLTPQPGDRGPVVVSIYLDSGENYLPEVLDLGPAFFKARSAGDGLEILRSPDFRLQEPISLPNFLEFAIGAAECLEILHHGHGIVHGEIRGDAFHFNLDTKNVKLVSLGSGLRSFEHGLTSTGWSMLSKEPGAKNKLLFISPEQTGRMPAEPDTRTDIYSLGILFWSLLTQKPVFEGATPLDVVQGVLNRRVPNVSVVRIDVPEAVGRIVAKCTEKSASNRYHSASGLRYDLQKVKQFLVDGDWLALKEWQVASKDVSSFFLLPPTMIGRTEEKARLDQVIERAAKGHALNQRGNANNRFSDGSTLSNELPDSATMYAEASSDCASSADGGTTRRSGSFTNTISTDNRLRTSFPPGGASHVFDGSFILSPETPSSAHPGLFGARATSRHWDRHQSVSFDTRSLADTVVSADRDISSRHSAAIDSVSLGRQLGSAKLRRRGHCEIVTIEGAGGLGKSRLLEAVWPEMRRKGYAAKAKFDTARKDPYGPLLKLLSSLFRQVWGGESNTETPLHQALRQQVRPIWKSLHKMLDLPEFLLNSAEPIMLRPPSNSGGGGGGGSSSSSSGALTTSAYGKIPSTRASAPHRRGSSPGSPKSLPRNSRISTQSSQDFLRAGTSTKSIRLMNSYLDILRTFTHYKFVCFCLEDLHFADDESMDLIAQIIAARMNMLILITYRPEELSAERIQKIIHPPELDELSKSAGPTITRIPLSPLSEDEIAQYVAATMRRPQEEISPLVLVIQSKTAGNPFYMKEMLSACHRKKCIWHDYRQGQWNFDLDRLFKEFEGEQNYDVLNTDFITRRLDELPPASRAILSWAALLGTSFSFDFICSLLRGDADHGKDWHSGHKPTGYSQEEAIAGLEAAVQAYILVQGDRDDRFRFAHDRYIQAAAKINSCDTRKMHFLIAQALMKHYTRDGHTKENTASHVCEALGIIRAQIKHRQAYRSLLYECAEVSIARGARSTAAKYYSGAVALLQPDPWNEDEEDVSYDETMKLYLAAAECYLFMGQLQLASGVLDTIFDCANSAFDKAPAWVLRSRVYAQSGSPVKALTSLKECLRDMGVYVEQDHTVEQCDADFEKLCVRIQSMEYNDILQPPCAQPRSPQEQARAESVGAVLAETISAAWWSDWLFFYQLSLFMLDLHLTSGAVPQSSMAFIHVSIIALARFNLVKFSKELGDYGFALLDATRDSFSMARGYMIHANFIGHVFQSVGIIAQQLEPSLDFAASAGDRISAILAFGLYAQLKFFASENCMDLEAICNYSCEEIPNWQLDPRGGAMLIAVRQVSRALQGKTCVSEALDVMSDDQHQAPAYKTWLKQNMDQTNRALLFYESLELAPLFLYGHYERAAEVAKFCVDNADLIWSSRNTRFAMLFYGLALAGLVLRQRQDPRTSQAAARDGAVVQDTVRELERLHKRIMDWQVLDKVNYFCWTRLLEAQIAELTEDHGAALQRYEEALDHAAEHDFVFEEALGNYLMAGTFIRLSSRRSAWAALRDTVSLYRQMGANGVAEHIESEHSLLMRGPIRNPRLLNVGVQTSGGLDVAESQTDQFRTLAGDGTPQRLTESGLALADARGERVGAWRNSMTAAESGAGLPSLDVLDLHAILQSSQIISSVLAVDELLKTMCDVILSTCGSSATLAAIVVQDESTLEWCVAASGDPEKGAEAHMPRIPLSGSSFVAENVVLYSTRFREAVFVPDVVADERFSNVSSRWLQRNPTGKAAIAMPICHGDKPLLGVLYIEGSPNSFTTRYRDVLQLLVNQVGISYSNALTMKAVEKVSAENVSMVQMQKQALEQAIEAEKKAKDAEAKARHNVKLAEEAAKAKSIFLANVSHELRTPLNGVIGNSELLRDSLVNKEQLEMADSIRVSADLLLTVINDILDFSRMEADKMKLYIIAFNPEEMVREVVRAVSYSNREKTSRNNVEIIKDINLPRLLIYGDPIRLHQVLGNLIGNSLKFTDSGSITIGARLDSETEETATLTFWVKDTGIGIPKAQLNKLFQPFSQADPSTARKYGGSGLGLSICKSLVENMMKGKIALESKDGEGTTAMFTVTFDKARPEVLAGEAQQQIKPHPPAETEHHRHQHYHQHYHQGQREVASAAPCVDLSQIPRETIRICVAEDNAINQKIAIQYVHRLGYRTVDAYDNGQLAVEALRKKANEGEPYHICLMDVQMPVLDGYAASQLIRRDPIEAVRNVLIIAMTASAVTGDRERCLAAGMNDYLAKPVRPDVLRKKLEAYVGADPVGQNTTTTTTTQSQQSPPTRSPPAAAASSSRFEPNGTPNASRQRDTMPATIISPRNSSMESIRSPVSATSRVGSMENSQLSDSGGYQESLADSTRRQPRKLTKNRLGSDMAKADGGMAVSTVEKMPKVLKKKNGPHRSGSTDAQYYEHQIFPGSGMVEGNSRSQSIASLSSAGSRERIGTYHHNHSESGPDVR